MSDSTSADGASHRSRRGREPSDAVLDRVLAGAQVVSGIIAASLAEVEDVITWPQLRVLVVTDERGSVNLSEVADLLNVHPSNATRLVERLVQADLVDRRDDPEDRRHLRLTLTSSGTRLVKGVLEHRRRAFRDVLVALPATAQVAIGDAMAVLAAAGPALTDSETWVLPTGRARKQVLR